ncbi:hypothetical protein N7495_003946 [Penicillium taxi]|uniref:uncharacterized protein n=1 Tax=Penicillium taxi TaxID=168475 RepID=UPI0025454DE9|nr:uncharacterized protein N7495_003946 [Penicillium taxi]KAJ5899202.1 hypothetical protein N7495_003946 [Penicillium taxi]
MDLFKGIVVSSVGKFKESEKVEKWVRANGGAFDSKITSNTTHLIATEQAYLEKGTKVEEAKNIGTINIVSYDWLLESLGSKNHRPKAAKPFLWEAIIRKKARDNAKERFKKDPETELLKKVVGSRVVKNLLANVIYIDSGNHIWSVDIVRLMEKPNYREKFTLAVFECNSLKNRTYSCYAKYNRKGISAVEILAPRKSDISLAITTFRDFYKLKTGKEWENRDDGKQPLPMTDTDGNILPAHEGWWIHELKKKSPIVAYLSDTVAAVDPSTSSITDLKATSPEEAEPSTFSIAIWQADPSEEKNSREDCVAAAEPIVSSAADLETVFF